MEANKETPYTYLVTCAKLGNRHAAIKILETIAWYVKRNRTIPKPFREYFVDCMSSVDINYKPNLNNAFNIVRTTGKGKKISTGKLFIQHMEMIDYIWSRIKIDGIKKTNAYKEAANKFHKNISSISELYEKYEAPKDNELTPYKIARVVYMFSNAVDSFKVEKKRG